MSVEIENSGNDYVNLNGNMNHQHDDNDGLLNGTNNVEKEVASIIDNNTDSSSGSDIVVELKNGINNLSVDENNYETVFPSLPTGQTHKINDIWNNSESKLSVKRHTTTQIFHVPVEERRYKDVANSFGNETNKKCEEIANRLGVKVEICCSKDQSLHIVISGLEEKVLKAKSAIVSELQTERDRKVKVPKEHHKYLIGRGGSILKDLQEKTCTSIQIPKPDVNSDIITITGPRDGIEQALHEIQLICEEQSKTGFERLNIPKLYHPWIRGFNNEIANEISQRTGAKINIPPPQIEKDEIAVSGEREKVDAACAEINRIYLEKSKLNITRLSIQITKSQHKLIIGKNGSTVQDIFKDYDVYVQVPKLESPSETIFLFGEESKLGSAFSQVCTKANSIVNVKIDAPSWLHRYMIGEKGANISKITAEYPNTHVKFENDNKIVIDGPPEEVEKVKDRLQAVTNALKKSMICEEITVEPKYYPQLVGKKYDNITRLNKEYNVLVRIPQQPEAGSTTTNNIVRIEGTPDAVQKAKADFLDLLKKVENERSKDIIIEQKYHSNLIGKNGKNLIEIRSKFNDVQINIPSQEEKSEVVTIRGNKVDVENCFKHLQKLIKDMQESNYQEEIQIFKQFHRMIIGKQGAVVRKIRDETQTRIDVPAEDSDSNLIVITGKRENVLRARKQIEEKLKELVKIEEDYVDIPHSVHTALIGKGGAIIKQIRQKCGGVLINFPPESTPSDRIQLKGPREEIEKAKEELLDAAKQKHDMSYTEDIHAKAEYHKFLVGKGGTQINNLRDKYKVRIIFPNQTSITNSTSADKDSNNNKGSTVSPNDIITIYGKEENVKAVKAELEKTIKDLDEQVTDEVNVDPKWHKNFTFKQAKLINKISKDNCNVKISFPKANNSSVVTLKGPKDAVEAAKKAINDVVYEFENQVTIEISIPQKHHSIIIGKNGANSQKISDDFKVEIQFPEKRDQPIKQTNNDNDDHNSNEEYNSSSQTSSPSKSDIIKISGLKENCENAKEAMMELLPISEDVEFPHSLHKFLLANKGELVREFRQNYNAQINVPKKGENTDYVTLICSKETMPSVKQALLDKRTEIELNNYKIEINDLKLIQQFRSKEAKKLEDKFKVRLEISRIGEPDSITISGKEADAKLCEAFIRKKIQEDESKVTQEIEIDSRVHSRIIGTQGKTLAKLIEKFKVDIKFQGDRTHKSDIVIVKGDNREIVEDACDHLKNLEEEYLQDVTDKEAYMHPSSKATNEEKSNGPSKGFVVRGAPWEQHTQGALNPNEPAPDTSNMEDFPTITAALNGPSSGQKMTWGPSRK